MVEKKKKEKKKLSLHIPLFSLGGKRSSLISMSEAFLANEPQRRRSLSAVKIRHLLNLNGLDDLLSKQNHNAIQSNLATCKCFNLCFFKILFIF